ncbi:MAG: dTDP-4-dehydrorhamnose reductase [Actinomycetota bacterium]|jgi:dTDP-4-dehydrorhamnose reductase|nr:dTDP-4-dehydrorhamnose reductase [Actinomycetota bacterium]
MRVLVTGAGGQLGREVVDAFVAAGSHHEVLACAHDVLDVGDRDSALQVIGTFGPDAVVHAAAWTDVDGCETDPDRAWRVNALGTRHVAEAARLVGARVCYVSTDYVFDGTGDRPYNEWDDTNPLSAYGRSKRAGESALGPDDTILRTSWVCGRHGHNFVKTVLRLVGAGQEMKVVDDQHGCPSFADDLAGMVYRLVVGRRPGLFHVTNQGPTTWYRFAADIAAAAGLDPALVRPIPTVELQPARPAPRPANSVLDNAALRLSGIPLLDDHHVPLERLVKELTAP